MSTVQWYYHRDGVRNGPISEERLFTMARSGDLGPADLVWKKGLEDWTLASNVEGLFAQQPLPNQVDVRRRSYEQIANPVSAQASFDPARAAYEFVLSRDINDFFPHIVLIDATLKIVKRLLTPKTINMIDLLAKSVGSVTYLLASALVVSFLAVFAIMTETWQIFLLALVTIPVVLIIHYTAVQSLKAGKVVIEQTPSRMSSDGLLRIVAVVHVVAGFGVLCAGTYGALYTGKYPVVLVCGLLAAFAFYLAALALTPAAVGVGISQSTSAGEEAIGILSFFAKGYMRAASFVFGVGGIVAVLLMVYLNIVLLSDGEQIRRGLGDPILLLGFPACASVILFGVVPFFVYAVFLISYLVVDVVASILALPHTLRISSDKQEDSPNGARP